MTQQNFHLIGHQICPYVQRVIILMIEKQIPYIRTDIDLDNKPDWLSKLSPVKKVPILVINEKQILFESDVICQYLDTVSPNSLYPKNTFLKASHCAWIAFATDILNLVAKLIYQDKSLNEVNKTLASIEKKLTIIESRLSDDDGFFEDSFYMVDAVFATIFRYFHVLGSLTNSNLFYGLPRILKWHNTLAKRQSIQNAVPINYNELLLTFIKEKGAYISKQKCA